jgi:hypothetical protein
MVMKKGDRQQAGGDENAATPKKGRRARTKLRNLILTSACISLCLYQNRFHKIEAKIHDFAGFAISVVRSERNIS